MEVRFVSHACRQWVKLHQEPRLLATDWSSKNSNPWFSQTIDVKNLKISRIKKIEDQRRRRKLLLIVVETPTTIVETVVVLTCLPQI